MPNGCTRRNSYDVCNQLRSISVTSPDGVEIHLREYEYDPAGHIVRVRGPRGLLWSYEYDALGRLILALGGTDTYRYAFDATDNWIYSPVLGPIHYEAGNRLAQAGNIAFLYDQGGNLAARLEGSDGETYEYDGQVLARSRRTDGPPIEYSYDALNRRTEKRVGEETVRYHWDAYTILGEQSGLEHVTYLFPPKSLTPLEMNREGKAYCYVTDHLGAPELLLDEDGDVAWRCQRSPWGEVETEEPASVENPLRLPGQYRDENG